MKRWKKNIASYVISGLWSLMILFIIGWIISNSFKSNVEVYQKPWSLPSKIVFENYASAWKGAKMENSFLNSLYVVPSAIVLLLVVASMSAFALTRFRFRFRQALMSLYVFGMSVPVMLIIIPLYSQLISIKLLNTLEGLILVYMTVWFPFSMFVLSGFFSTIPLEIEESAIIDGAGQPRLFFNIMIPLVQPGLICVGVLNFVAMWNEFMLSLIFISNPKLRTISLGMYALKDSMMYSSNWGGLFAAIVIMLIPSLIIFITLQKYVIKGLTLGAVKG